MQLRSTFLLPWRLLPALFCLLCALLASFGAAAADQTELAQLPPRGWNSYDSFSWVVDEEAFLKNAEIVAEKLLDHGYEYVVVDYLWYRKFVTGASVDSYGYDYIDEWGRPYPDPGRWPSSVGGLGFRKVADKIHKMGLKFGLHLMRGISTQAVDANKPILDIYTGYTYLEGGGRWSAKDIGQRHKTCGWMKHGFMSVDTDLGAGRAFLRSLYHQYADWGVDFVKLDCVFGDDYSPGEIITVSELLEELNQPMIISISPGTSVTPSMANDISRYVNMYRITADDWDTWQDVVSHFNISRDFADAKKIAAEGFHGRSWPDLDMLPLGWLTDPYTNLGPHRDCRLNLNEQKTQITLWSMAKSPLMFGGDLRHIDNTTFDLITHPTLLEINSYSSNNQEFPFVLAGGILSDGNRGIRKLKGHANLKKSGDMLLSLTSCNNERARGWYPSSRDAASNRVCWYSSMEGRDDNQFCLAKRKLPYASDETIMQDTAYGDTFHLVPTEEAGVCLDASVNGRRTASEIYSVLLSRCRWHGNQMWQLNDNGTMVNSYSNLCAMAAPSKDNAVNGGTRSWIATGRRGEIYVALFNLNSESAEITLRVSDLRKVLQGSFFRRNSCDGTDAWSGRSTAVVDGRLADVVPAHGCSLFVLNC